MNRRCWVPGAAITLLALQLVGCGGETRYDGVGRVASDGSLRTYVYECEGMDPFTVRVEDEKAWLFLPSGTVDLPQTPAESGARFSDGGSVYWSEGEKARFVLNGRAFDECRNNRMHATWEDAKLRGADFRAIGNEPGWQLEIFAGDTVVFVNNYGQERHLFRATVPEINEATRTTRYLLINRDHRLMVILQGRSCVDSMTGEAFGTTATLIFDGRPLGGCGKALH